MHQTIREQLHILEWDHGVSILYAAESGSRAWGFDSENSDYDVRGIYVREPEWYLSIDVENKRDVIEETIGDLDISLWDLRKTLQLMKKSNPALLEWFRSPVVYKYSPESRQIQDLVPHFYSPRRAAFHYYHMALNNWKRYLQDPAVKAKKYLYVLRPILVLRWIEVDIGPPPVEFDFLLNCVSGDINKETIAEIRNLVEQKRNGHELGEMPRNKILHQFLEDELERYASLPDSVSDNRGNTELLNRVFREIINR